jgi:hypothetical protein
MNTHDLNSISVCVPDHTGRGSQSGDGVGWGRQMGARLAAHSQTPNFPKNQEVA